MRTITIFLLYAAVLPAAVAQTHNATGTARVKSTQCGAVANTGNKVNIVVNCPSLSADQSEELANILNKLLAERDTVSLGTISEKLDEILKSLSPYRPVITYDCAGYRNSTGRSARAIFDIQLSAPDPSFRQMMDMLSRRDVSESKKLLTVCTDQIKEKPEWLTPVLVCSAANLSLGNRNQASKLLDTYEAKKGAAYEASPCTDIEMSIKQRLLAP